MESNPCATLSEIREKISTEFDVHESISTVENWLDGELIYVKNVRPSVVNMNNEVNKVKRAEYMDSLFQARSSGRTLIWTDETNFNLYCKRREGRSKIGTRASVIIPASKGANLHCIAAIKSSDLLLFSTRRGAFKADDCVNWFQELIELCNERRIEEPTIIFDNAPAHCRVETLSVQYPHVQFLRLAPYSYLLNPIELVWSILKTEIKSKLRERMPHLLNVVPNNGISMAGQRMAEMERIANESVNIITPVKLMVFSNRVEKYYPAATRREDLKEMS